MNHSPEGETPLLRVERLGIELNGQTLLENLNFEVRPRETLVILGPNGAGKSVLLRTLLGLLPHTGKVIWKSGVRIGYVPQRVPLKKELPVTVSDFFDFKKIGGKKALDLLQAVGLEGPSILNVPLGRLSSGQFQRVLIAWAFAREPDILLFDEPMAGVDIGGEDAVHQFLHRTQTERNAAVILVTHDLATVYREATRVLGLNQKRSCYGKPREVLTPASLEKLYGRKLKYFEPPHA